MKCIVIVGLIPDNLDLEQAEAIMLAGTVPLEAAGAEIQVAIANVDADPQAIAALAERSQFEKLLDTFEADLDKAIDDGNTRRRGWHILRFYDGIVRHNRDTAHGGHDTIEAVATDDDGLLGALGELWDTADLCSAALLEDLDKTTWEQVYEKGAPLRAAGDLDDSDKLKDVLQDLLQDVYQPALRRQLKRERENPRQFAEPEREKVEFPWVTDPETAKAAVVWLHQNNLLWHLDDSPDQTVEGGHYTFRVDEIFEAHRLHQQIVEWWDPVNPDYHAFCLDLINGEG